jgi:hypothetical protein
MDGIGLSRENDHGVAMGHGACGLLIGELKEKQVTGKVKSESMPLDSTQSERFIK